ncbi:DUF3809 domain-containing protein [Deinococcus peraridilitoris]|uniref:Polyketide cyclase / dehydrase and lipid transport n=1 Tax=Deinococcus peraridilitoris (strain DSM 19664 / LMG 22246 / CIP 109416 / KR-200) TaxID=937777 RepID=L0A0W6_DEIPD|nr:DUF3809 domain-containing protein [Deinococcus peraridilitoris]AFZ66630.1 hypothetical protein Deipe_1067 [Deinococcus peraridilitoris DSM 19664]
MIFEAQEHFVLPYPGSEDEARSFLRDPGRSLRAVSFLRALRFDGGIVRSELAVNIPMFGDLVLPFESEVTSTAQGALLTPRPLSGRAWAEVGGLGEVQSGQLDYHLSFRVHISMPQAEKWGGAAFEKMFQATARKTLERVAQEFPAGVRAAMP